MNDRTPQESGARDMPPRIDARLLGLAADALAAVLPADAAQAERLFAIKRKRCVYARHQPLRARFLVARGAVDLAREI